MDRIHTIGVIYLARNKLTGKCYIGSSTSFKCRKGAHISMSKTLSRKKKPTYFHYMLMFFGDEQFEWVILQDGVAYGLLLLSEAKAILKHNTLVPHGYNMSLPTRV